MLGVDGMNYFGAYHVDIRPQALNICDAPHISKGQMTLSGFETASDAKGMALVHGRLRNREALARSLDCAPYASQAQLALSAYEKWGDEYALHLEGPCLSCIADVQRGRMIICRDRMGENALFYVRRQGCLIFADHPDMLVKSTFMEPVMDRDGVCEIFGLGPARTPGKTPYRDMRELQAGCMMICEDGEFEIRRYFDLAARPHEDDEKNTVAHVRSLLEACVGNIIPLHPAAMLSGGIDSTALTALLSMRIGRLMSFSVDYQDNEKDFVANSFRPEMDAPYIQSAVRLFGSRHSNIILEQDTLAEGLGQAVRARGLPGMADIDVSLMLFAREIVRRAPSVVSGECGDEVFGGYPWFAPDAPMPEESFPWSGSIELRESILRGDIREKIGLRGYVSEAMHRSLEEYDVSAVEGEDEKRMFRLQRLCFDYFMKNLQERAVKMCEIQGLQVITPLCDDRLVQYVYNVPWRMKRMGGMEKGLFREAMRDLLPDRLRLRKKSPYPKTCSAAYTSIIRGRMRELCADSRAPLWTLVDAGSIERIASAQLSPADTPWFGQLMAGPQMLAYLLQVNTWMRERSITVEL